MTYRADGFKVLAYAEGQGVTIGEYTSIGDDCLILDGGEHYTGRITTYPPSRMGEDGDASYSRGPVVIGNDVWIGTRVTILSGVTIGDGAVIGACSLVNRDVPPYAIAVGVPAKVTRYRFKPDEIAALLALRWWDWPDAKVRELWPLLIGNDVAALVAATG